MGLVVQLSETTGVRIGKTEVRLTSPRNSYGGGYRPVKKVKVLISGPKDIKIELIEFPTWSDERKKRNGAK